MDAYEISATVEPSGQIRLGTVPFAPGTEVEVIISPERSSPEQFSKRWNRLCQEMRARAGELAESDIQREIAAFRARE